MIKTCFKASILLVLVSCDSGESQQTAVQEVNDSSIEEVIQKIPAKKVEVITYDGCEYLILKEDKDTNSSYGFMAHKGNCSNAIHEGK